MEFSGRVGFCAFPLPCVMFGQFCKCWGHVGFFSFCYYPYLKIPIEQDKDYSNQISSKTEEIGTLRNIK